MNISLLNISDIHDNYDKIKITLTIKKEPYYVYIKNEIKKLQVL